MFFILGQWVDAEDGIYGDPVEKAERANLGKPPPINPGEIGISPEAIAAREADLEHIGLAAEQTKSKEESPAPHPVDEDLIKHMFGNLMSVYRYLSGEAAKKGETLTVPPPRLEEFLPQHQQYPMAPPSTPASSSGLPPLAPTKVKARRSTMRRSEGLFANVIVMIQGLFTSDTGH